MTIRVVLCIVPLLLAAVAHADPGELFPGKGRDPASQPDARPVVTRPPATQPAGKTPTTKPETLTITELIKRLPEDAWEKALDAEAVLAAEKRLTELFAGSELVLKNVDANVGNSSLTIGGVLRDDRAIGKRLTTSIDVFVPPELGKLKKPVRRPGRPTTVNVSVTAEITRISLRHGIRGSELFVGCIMTKR